MTRFGVPHLVVVERSKEWRFTIGDPVEKTSGASWRGRIVGFYSTSHTPRGYCVESRFEPGSVQIYPEAALGPYSDPA